MYLKFDKQVPDVDIVLVEVPVPVTEALRNAKELSLSFVNGPLRSGFGNRYRYR